MTANKTERLPLDQSTPEKTGPEKFAPERRIPDRLGEIDQAAANAFEGEIREFVRRDVTQYRQRQNVYVETPQDPAADNLDSLIRRVSGASMEEIDRVIIELQGVREMLRKEGERVNREITGYASLSHAAVTAMRVIGDSLKQWQGSPNEPPAQGRRSAG